MAPQRPRVLSEGQLPIHLYEIDDANAKSVTQAAETLAGSNSWSQSHYESALSSPSDEQTLDPRLGEDKSIESSPAVKSTDKKLLKAYKATRNKAAARRIPCSSDNTHTSYTSDLSDERPESFEETESEFDFNSSSDSSGSDDAEASADLEVAQTGQQFGDRDRQVSDGGADSDIDLQAVRQPASKASAAALAPFRDGGLPNVPRRHIRNGEPSEITDFGELMFSESGKNKPRVISGSTKSSPGERRSAKKSLQQRLFSALQTTHQGKKDFFPRTILSTIINEQCVREELWKQPDLNVLGKKKLAEHAAKICEETEFEVKIEEKTVKKIRCFRKIFVILVLIKKTSAIIPFLDRDVNDSDLPLEKVERQHERGAYDLRRCRNSKKRLKCFSKQWDQLDIRNFEEYQWTTLSPFFGKGGYKEVKHYPLQDQVVLPFIEVATRKGQIDTGRTLVFEGGFGKVFKVDIHPDHHNFESVTTNTRNQSFAVKCLHSPDKKRFKKEVEMLKKFSNPAHEHLISLLATYEQFKSFFLIFHWAEADLQRYWREINPTPTMDRKTVLWVIKQCKGIADGVVKIHQYTSGYSKHQFQPVNQTFGHHGDIKPENVLLFPDPDYELTKRGTLKLSDFGLADLSLHQTVTMQPKSSFATSPPYRAPEVDLEGTGAIGRSYDIWTLGCLYLEFITWLIEGWDLVTYFSVERMQTDPLMFGQSTDTFFRLVKVRQPDGNCQWIPSAEIKPAVTQFIDERLYGHESCTDFLREFLDMIKNDLLVIQTHDRKTRGRLSCEQVHAKLCTMLRKCEADEKYACEPTPRSDTVSMMPGGERKPYILIDTVNLPEAGSSYPPVSDILQS